MQWLNYHHLLYFWTVAREGTVTGAARELSLSPSTVSEQIRLLEEAAGQPLFQKSGRNIVLTDVGRTVFRYADDIFTLGRELQEYVAGRQLDRVHLHVGVSMVIPKLIAARLLAPAFELDQRIHLICREAPIETLLADLALHHLDIVLTDAPLGPDARIKAFNHPLGSCGVVFMAAPALAARLRADFPASLDGAPFLLPTATTVVRRMLDRWLAERDLHPEVIAEFDDSALLNVFAQQGMGVFAAPEAVVDDIAAQFHLETIGVAEGLEERFYAISVERRLSHPAIVAINQHAQARL